MSLAPGHSNTAATGSTTAAAGTAAAAATAEEADDEEPETLPLLARRVMAGRQSIVPHHTVLAQQHTVGMGSFCFNAEPPL